MQQSSYLPRVLCVITYLFTIGITIWALYQPYMTNAENKLDEYTDKQCIANNCGMLKSDVFANQGTAIKILYIIFIVLAILCLVLSFTKHTKLCGIVGILLLCMALVVMITLIIVVKTSSSIIFGFKLQFEFTVSTILVIVACCLMIVKQLVYNNMLHSVGRAIMRK